jgi:aryl-alcohol dehydrogenase-like predicted oxidoreductase
MPRPAASQVVYNVLIRQLELEYFAFARRHPIHTAVYNPLAGGFLAGLHRPAAFRPGSRFDRNALYQRRYGSPRFFEWANAMGAIAAEEGLTLLELAYAWLSDRTGVDSILLGPADVAQLDAGIDAVTKRLSKRASQQLDALHVAFTGTDATYAR